MRVLDTETMGLNPRVNKATHIGIYCPDRFDILKTDPWNQLAQSDYIAHNAKFDMLMLHYTMKQNIAIHYDTMLLSQLYDSRQKHTLDNLGQLYVGEGKWGDKKINAAIKKGEFHLLPIEDQHSYL